MLVVHRYNIQMFYRYGHISLTMFSRSDWRMHMQSLPGSPLPRRKPEYEARLHTKPRTQALGGRGEKRAWLPLLAHALNYGVPISMAFYGRGEMKSKYVATQIVCVHVRTCVTTVTELA